jgi:hypothetical protein
MSLLNPNKKAVLFPSNLPCIANCDSDAIFLKTTNYVVIMSCPWFLSTAKVKFFCACVADESGGIFLFGNRQPLGRFCLRFLAHSAGQKNCGSKKPAKAAGGSAV